MNELTPRGHLRPLGGRENPRRARPESRSPRRCAYAWRRCLLFAGRPEGIDQGTHDRHARASPRPQLHMRKGVNRNPSRRPGLAVSDSNLHAVKTGHSESAAFPGYTPLRPCLRYVRAGQNSRDTQTCPMTLQLSPSAQHAEARERGRSGPGILRSRGSF